MRGRGGGSGFVGGGSKWVSGCAGGGVEGGAEECGCVGGEGCG